MNTVQGYRKWLEGQKTERAYLVQEIGLKKDSIEAGKTVVGRQVKARWVLGEVARLTQTAFKQDVENLVTMAIRSVMDQPLEFCVDFEIKRNKSECFLRVKERAGGEPYVPKDEQGGGLADIISIALRVVFWSLQRPRSRNVFILDEPLRFIGKGEPLKRAGNFLKEISHRLGVQFIIVTHEPELAETADRAWYVWHNGTYSEVNELTEKIGTDEKNWLNKTLDVLSKVDIEVGERKELEL